MITLSVSRVRENFMHGLMKGALTVLINLLSFRKQIKRDCQALLYGAIRKVLTMKKLTKGQKAIRSTTVTDDHVQTYANLCGDYNPLYFDKNFTAKTKFKNLVVQGGLTTGLLHALVAMDMPGPGTAFLSQDWKFTAPVFIGDTITAEAEVLNVHESKPVTNIAFNITRQNGETVLEGEAWCYTFSAEE